jgi:hypothetical protein
MHLEMDKTPIISTAGFGTSWAISQLNEYVGLGIGVMTLVYISLRVFYLVKNKGK